MMDIENYLKNFYKGTRKPTLKTMKYFMDKYNSFDKQMKFIHIAGTNGKGSCTEIISNILIKQGYKVGKFLSPHLIKYNERISINGKEITNEEMEKLINELNPLINSYNKKEKSKVTFFELETIMALLYFYRNNVDFVVLETGLGGLYDSTNIITKPLVSIITSIGYDHIQMLGNTLQEIAYQKAGIIKEESNTVIFEQIPEVERVFQKECEKKNNNLYIVKNEDISNYSFNNEFQTFNYKNIKNLKINLKGKIQTQNASICIEAIEILKRLGYVITEESIRNGLKSVVHKARMEQLNNSPLIIYDGAHNEPAIKNLQEMIKMYYKDYEKVYIISILKRKDYKNMLKLLSQDKHASFILTSGNDPNRFTNAEELYEHIKKYIPEEKLYIKSLKNALEYIMKNNLNVINFVVGSFYTYGDTIKILREIKNNT